MKSLFGGPVRGHVQAEVLSAYLDGQTSPAERAYVDAHLQECGACQAELDSLRGAVSLLQALPRVALPRAFTLSEAQVGIRRPAPTPGWMGGLVRGLGAVAAIALIALVAVSVLRPEQAPWSPDQTIARALPPTTAAVTAAIAEAPAPAPAAQEAPPPQSAEPAPGVATNAVETAPMAAAPAEPTPAPEQPATMAAAAPQAEAGATTEAAPPTAADAANVADASATAPGPTATTEEPQLLAKAEPSPEPEMGAAAMGRGGGGFGGGAGAAGAPAEYLTPEPTPPARPLASALPPALRFAYADLNALWAVDRGGTRQLVQGSGINTPQLSPDQQWIAYRTYTNEGIQLWAVRWGGGEPKLLLDDAKLPTERLPEGYARRAFSDSRWGPDNKTLSITLSLIPQPDKTLPQRLEHWLVDVETGNLRFANELGRAWRPFYSPTGRQFLTVEYGTEEAPEGAVTLYESGSPKGTTVLSFPASPGKPSYDGQIAWAPNGQAAWIAVPTADYGQPNPPNGTKLYRLDGPGPAKQAGEIDASQVSWSPDGKRMAYTRFISDTLATNELYIADADGSNAELYATMTQGEFIAWSPSGKRFLYQDNFQVLAGEPGQPPQRLANGVSMVGPRWVSDGQVMASHDTGDGWLLAMRDVNGDAVGLLPLAREAMWDVDSGR